MAATAGYKAAVKVSGTSTAFTSEAASLVAGTTSTYQINDATKRVWDRTVTPTVNDGATQVTPTSIDYLRGRVTLASAAAGAVTITGNYLPMTTVAEATEYSTTWERQILDSTALGGDGWRTRALGLYDGSASLTIHYVGTFETFAQALAAGNAMVLEFYPDGSGATTTADIGWFKPSSEATTIPVEELVGQTIEFELDAGGAGKAFSLAGTATS